MRSALLLLITLAACGPAAAASAQSVRQRQQAAPGELSRAHDALLRTLSERAHRPGGTVPAARKGRAVGGVSRGAANIRPMPHTGATAGRTRQATFLAAPGHGAIGGPAKRPAPMALSGVRRRP
jgi:hypothetical protein